MPNNTRYLLFDIDGTLLDPQDEGAVCMQRAMEDVYDVTGPIDSFDMAGKTDWQIVTELLLLADLDDETIKALRPKVFAAYAKHVEIAAPFFKMRLLPGVDDLLKILAGNNQFKPGLVTGNVREAVPYKLRAVGIDPGLFSYGAFGSEHIDRNMLPALALYRVEQILGEPVSPDSALVIGDTPRDIACARHAGVKVLGVATGQYSVQSLAAHEPDYLLEDLSNTEQVMEILGSY